MPSTPSSPKAGKRGIAAVVAGVGDGSVVRQASLGHVRVIAICLPGERPLATLPPNAYQFVVRGPEDAPQVASTAWGSMSQILELEGTTFLNDHPIGVPEPVRTEFCRHLYHLLSERPLSMGDDVIDGIQGAYHVALTAHLLAGAPTPDELPRLSCPAISVASGPSLAKHLPALRELQRSCLIVCADTALEGLIKAGVTPHVVTPLERVTAIANEAFPADRYPGVIFGGSPVAHQHIAPKFDRHMLVPGSDILFTWMGCRHDQLFYHGQSTGVLSAILAARMTAGPVYLVGHDLAFAGGKSHWDGVHDGVQLGANVERLPIDGHDGTKVDSQRWWIVFRNELSDLAKETGRIANVNAIDGSGAAIAGTLALDLPDPAALPDLALPEWPDYNHARADAFADVLERLPDEARAALLALSSSQLSVSLMDFQRLIPGLNGHMMGYVFRSILGQFSMEALSGSKPREQTVSQCGAALRSGLRQLMRIFDEMGTCQLVRERQAVGAA